MSTDDDDALTWAGDESDGAERPRRDALARTPRRRRQDEELLASDAGPDADGEAVGPDAVAERQTGSVALVLLGLLGGVHLLYAAGWALTLAPLDALYGPVDVLGAAMFTFGLGLAAVSPLVWVAASFWFTRSRPAWQRVAALFAGAVILLPWPFIVGVR